MHMCVRDISPILDKLKERKWFTSCELKEFGSSNVNSNIKAQIIKPNPIPKFPTKISFIYKFYKFVKLKITITLPLSYLPNSTIQNNETKVILILVNHCMCLFGFLFVTRKS